MLRKFLVIAALLATNHLQAREVTYDGKNFDLPIPAGYCPLDDKNQFDVNFVKFMTDMQAGQNAILLTLYPCEALSELRAGVANNNAFEYGMYLLQLDKVAQKPVVIPSSVSPKQYFDAVANSLNKKTLANLSSDIKSRLESSEVGKAGNLAVNSSDVGILEQAQDAVYLAIATNMMAGNKPVSSAGVSCLTLIGENSISGNFYALYQDEKTYEALLARCKDTVRILKSKK
jgi:hypothetical protein